MRRSQRRRGGSALKKVFFFILYHIFLKKSSARAPEIASELRERCLWARRGEPGDLLLRANGRAYAGARTNRAGPRGLRFCPQL